MGDRLSPLSLVASVKAAPEPGDDSHEVTAETASEFDVGATGRQAGSQILSNQVEAVVPDEASLCPSLRGVGLDVSEWHAGQADATDVVDGVALDGLQQTRQVVLNWRGCDCVEINV